MDLRQFFTNEVKPSLGCTEPGAIAYAAAKAASTFTGTLASITLRMSMSIYKNGRSVGIPGTDGLQGTSMAAALGAIAGDASKGLMALDSMDPEKLKRAVRFANEGRVHEDVVKGTPSVWVEVELAGDGHTSLCRVAHRHDYVEQLVVDGKVVHDAPLEAQTAMSPWLKELMEQDMDSLWAWAKSIDADIEKLMLEGAAMNMHMAEAQGADAAHGIGIGKVLAKYSAQLPERIKQAAGSASDTRMCGGNLPVMSSAGSGNHGIVAVIPVTLTARELKATDRQLAEALALSHLVCGYIKAYTGRLTPICGCSVAAGAGAAAGMVMLHGGTSAQAERAAITLVGTLLGMICDGAKASCGLKVSSAAGEAWMAAMLALNDMGIQTTQGLISTNIRELGATVKDFNDKALHAADAVMVSLMVGLDSKKGCQTCA